MILTSVFCRRFNTPALLLPFPFLGDEDLNVFLADMMGNGVGLSRRGRAIRRSVSGERMDLRGGRSLVCEEDFLRCGGLMGDVKSTGLPIISRTRGNREP